MAKSSSREFEKFDAAMRELIKVPHSEIVKELEKEKRAKAKKKSVPRRKAKP